VFLASAAGCFCRCFKKRKITRGCSRSRKQASPYATEDREFAVTACTGILPLPYVSSLLECFLQIQFLYFDLKLRLWMFCKIPGFAVAVKFMRLSCHVLCFVFSISHVSVTWYQIESLFFVVSSENILGFAAADQTFDLGALY